MRKLLPAIVLVAVACSWDPPAAPPPSATKAEGRRPDSPGEAALYRFRRRLSEDGTMPPDALVRAKRQRDAMVAAQEAEDRGGVSRGAWRWLGPRNVGGRIRAILIHPTQPDVMWVGSVSGGIWKTTDAGDSWVPLDDFMASLAVGCMAMDPTNPDVLYAGTGEGFYNGDSVRGAGIFKSVDGGATWARIPTTNPAPLEIQWRYINRIAIDPTDPMVLLAATNLGIYRTMDGGATAWTQQTLSRTLDVRFHPTNGMFAVAGQADGVALYSTDGGINWNPAAGLPAPDGHRVELAYARAAPHIVVASIARLSGGVYSTAGIYDSLDGGQSYVARNTLEDYLGQQGWYDNAVWVDPTDAAGERLVVGGIDLWRSLNSGRTLTRISNWRRVPEPGDSAHADQHVIVHHPGYDGVGNRTVFVGNDGGIYRADDILTVTETSGWTSLNNGLGITQFYGAAVHPDTGVVLGGTQDNATLRHPGSGFTWSAIGVLPGPSFTGDGGFCAATIDPGGPGTFFGEYNNLVPFRSTDGGLTASRILDGLGDSGRNPPQANFIAPLVLDPNDSSRLLAGGASLWRCNNALAPSPAWASIMPPEADFISAIAVADGNPDIVWVGRNGGQVFKTTNGTAALPAWTRMDRNGPGLPARHCSRIAIDRNDHDRVYVTFMGFAPDNVWRTSDGGMGWELRNGGGALPSLPVSAIALHRSERDWIYLGTDLGVFASTDGGGSWSAMTEGPANVVVDELAWKRDTLLAVTHGRGLYEADVGPMPVPVPGRTTRVSISSAGVEGNGVSGHPSLSADGRFVAFWSAADNLVPQDRNFTTDIFVHDRLTGRTERVSVSSSGEEGDRASLQVTSISADGRFVAFGSEARNLVPMDTNQMPDAFVHDRQTGRTERVSVSSSGQQTSAGSSNGLISPNGRFVAFQSRAADLVPGGSNGFLHVYLHDRATRRTTRASISTAGDPADLDCFLRSEPSDDGTVTFSSQATNLVPGVPLFTEQVYLHDPVTPRTELLSLSSSGQVGDNGSSWPSISRDGLLVAFESLARNLAPGVTNRTSNIFVRDRRPPETTSRVSLSSSGEQANARSQFPRISHDGGFVTFSSFADNLVPGDTNGFPDVFIHDRQTAMTARVSVSSTGQQGDGTSYGICAVSEGGRLTAFASGVTNLVPGDTNGVADIFVHDAFPVVATADTARPGTTVRLDLHSPDDPNLEYVMGASLGTVPGIPVDRRVIPLNPDALLLLSLQAPAVFENFIGVLDQDGRATAAIRVPPEPFLVGLAFHVAWFTRRASAPSGIGTISLPLRLVIVA